MKKTIQKIALSITFTFSLLNVIAQDRNVAWIHGLDGNANSWKHYNQIFDKERNLNSLRTTYNTDNGITYSTNKVIGSMNTRYKDNAKGANNPRNLGIGHSMGGLMLRDADRITANGTKKFGGYITVASPNYGAPIANSLLNGSVQNAAENACNKLTDGPLSQLIPVPFNFLSDLSTDVLCNIFIDNNLIQSFQGSPVTNKDLRVGSPTIDAINDYDTNLPRISIWAEENSPVHWRMLSSQMFGNDTDLVKIAKSVRAVYDGFYIYNKSKAVVSGVLGFFNPYIWGFTALYGYRATQWKKGRNWIDDSENIWSSLIKTTRREKQTYWALTSVFGGVWTGDNTIGSLGLSWKQHTRFISVNYPSDGLLPQYTQELQDIPIGNRYKVQGANHTEVRNMTTDGNGVDETKDVFDDIFDREDWFGTN
jgi:triacylglycerol esterase/lipase EstA (alpha/beta hydrolase family)